MHLQQTKYRFICLFFIFIFLVSVSVSVQADNPHHQTSSSLSLVSTSTMSPQPSPPSFYKRTLPESCVALSSKRGKQVFASAHANSGLKSFFPLIEQFMTQSEPAYCGISTLVLVLNAFSVDPQQTWKGPWRWYEENMLNCCMDLEQVKKTGITLRDFQCLAHCQGLSVDLHYGDSVTLDDFRAAVQTACVEAQDNDNDNDNDNDDTEESALNILVVSYCRKNLGQTGSGHFSPIAAYDVESDSVLILDTARFKYGAHWAPLPLLFEAMGPMDPATCKSRGYCLLSFSSNHHTAPEISTQPLSLLFRSKMSENPIRRKYKDYLTTLATPISWSQVFSYWSKDGSDWLYVWKIMEPQRHSSPTSTEAETVRNVQALIKDLLRSETEVPASSCQGKNCGGPGTSCIGPQEALYVVYLASLEEPRRREIVMDTAVGVGSSTSTTITTLTRQQLLSEANLIATAIEMSDQSSF